MFLALSLLHLLHPEIPTPSEHQQTHIRNKSRRTYHPLSSPPLKNEQSPLTTQSQPPATPFPFLHSTSGISSGVLLSNSSRASALFDLSFLSNLLKLHVKHRKSSSSSLGILPVNTRPITIILAACVHTSSALGCLGSLSDSAIILAMVYAIRAWSVGMDSPFTEGTRTGV